MMAHVKNLSFRILKISTVEMPSRWQLVELQVFVLYIIVSLYHCIVDLPMIGMTVQAVRVLLATAMMESSSSRRDTSPDSASFSTCASGGGIKYFRESDLCSSVKISRTRQNCSFNPQPSHTRKRRKDVLYW